MKKIGGKRTENEAWGDDRSLELAKHLSCMEMEGCALGEGDEFEDACATAYHWFRTDSGSRWALEQARDLSVLREKWDAWMADPNSRDTNDAMNTTLRRILGAQ